MIVKPLFVVRENIGGGERDCRNKKRGNPFVWDSHLLRCLADSNRRRRFCRPLTKPLIQGTE